MRQRVPVKRHSDGHCSVPAGKKNFCAGSTSASRAALPVPRTLLRFGQTEINACKNRYARNNDERAEKNNTYFRWFSWSETRGTRPQFTEGLHGLIRDFPSIEIERKHGYDEIGEELISFSITSFVPRCAPTVWDHEQDSQTTFFAACDHPPEVAEEVDASKSEKERGKGQRMIYLSQGQH